VRRRYASGRASGHQMAAPSERAEIRVRASMAVDRAHQHVATTRSMTTCALRRHTRLPPSAELRAGCRGSKGVTLAVHASRPRHMSVALKVAWPPAARSQHRAARRHRGLPLAIRRAPGVRRRGGESGLRTPVLSREQVRTQKSSGVGIRLPCVKILDGLLCKPWPIRDQ
jgi:hypothetical protein